MLKKEQEEDENSCKEMYLNFSKRLNDLINVYFSATRGGK